MIPCSPLKKSPQKKSPQKKSASSIQSGPIILALSLNLTSTLTALSNAAKDLEATAPKLSGIALTIIVTDRTDRHLLDHVSGAVPGVYKSVTGLIDV